LTTCATAAALFLPPEAAIDPIEGAVSIEATNQMRASVAETQSFKTRAIAEPGALLGEISAVLGSAPTALGRQAIRRS
jgi:hypothetical protein